MSAHGAAHGKGRKHKGGHEEEHENHERWLISYADMLTLLFVLFVVLYAISSVNQQKFDALRDGMAKGFGSPVGGLNGSTGALSDPGTQPLLIDQSVAQTVTGGAKSTGAPSKEAVDAAKKLLKAQAFLDAEKKAEELKELQERLEAELTKKGLQNTVDTRVTSRGVVITVLSSSVVFAPDSAVLRQKGKEIIGSLVPVLTSVDNDISIEGNTDTTAKSPKNYASEFNLSADRACNVVNYLDRFPGLGPERLSCTGNGAENPLMKGTSQKANTLNRRVDIIVLADGTDKADSLDESAADNLSATATAADEEQDTADDIAAHEAENKSAEGH